MTVGAVAVHDTERPQAAGTSNVSLHTVTVLVDFAHLRDESRAGLDS